MLSGRKLPKHADKPLLFVMYVVIQRLKLNLEVKKYCEGQNSAKCYNGNLSGND